LAFEIGLLTISSGAVVFAFGSGEPSPKPLRSSLGGVSPDPRSETEIARLRRATRKSALAHMDLGVALSQAGKYTEALTELETVLKLRPE
jgi:hypothetical protein